MNRNPVTRTRPTAGRRADAPARRDVGAGRGGCADHRRRAADVRGPLAGPPVHRAAAILASPPTTATLSPHAHSAVSALLTTSYGFDAEHRIDPDGIAWAYAHGGALHIIEHPADARRRLGQ